MNTYVLVVYLFLALAQGWHGVFYLSYLCFILVHYLFKACILVLLLRADMSSLNEIFGDSHNSFRARALISSFVFICNLRIASEETSLKGFR